MNSEENGQVIEIKSLQDFLGGLKILLADTSFPRENISTFDFVEAMHAWLVDVDGQNSFFEEPNDKYITWSDLFILIQAAAVYE
ncbi:DUF7660 family protein [Ochrobactrum quorumnocens]|uniref:DUF7660 family protein n=1 Tax=Ochrobactrum quorumnocens TaxID=271865 RepID=UPI0012FD103A|nr:hypothetical protein [[Ochrobactrum] quorumnocens]